MMKPHRHNRDIRLAHSFSIGALLCSYDPIVVKKVTYEKEYRDISPATRGGGSL